MPRLALLRHFWPEMQEFASNEARREDISYKSLKFHVAVLRTSIELYPDRSFFQFLGHIYLAPIHGSSYFMIPSSIALI